MINEEATTPEGSEENVQNTASGDVNRDENTEYMPKEAAPAEDNSPVLEITQEVSEEPAP